MSATQISHIELLTGGLVFFLAQDSRLALISQQDHTKLMAKPKKKVAENKSETSPETKTFQDRLDQRISRRQAISRMGAAAIGIGAVAAAAAGGYYYVSAQGGPQRTTTTSSAGPIRIDFFIWEYGVEMGQENVARYNGGHPESKGVLGSSRPGKDG